MNIRRITITLVFTVFLVLLSLLYRSHLSLSEANREDRAKASKDRKTMERQHSEQVSKADRLAASNAILTANLQAERITSQSLQKRLVAAEQAVKPVPIEVPQTVGGIGQQWGSLKSKVYTFNQKYPKGPPAKNTPDYEVYVNDLDQLTSGLTPIMLNAQELTGLTSEPSEKARFRASMISEALALDQVQASGIEGILMRAFQQSPSPSKDFSESVAAQVTGLLTVDQQAQFKTMFGGNFLNEIKFSIYGNDGKETSF